MKKQTGKKEAKKALFAGIVLSAFFVGSMTGCGSAGTTADSSATSYDSEAYYAGAAYDDEDVSYDIGEDAYETADYENDATYGLQSNGTKSAEQKNSSVSTADTGAAGTDLVNQAIGKKKIIKRYSIDYETETFDTAYAYLQEQIAAYQGYISDSEIYGTGSRTLNLTARIPAEVSDEFTGMLGELGILVSRSESAEDITLQYTDTQSRINALKTEQDRLNDLLKQADSLETIIALEDRLTEVRYELENYQSRKNLYDDLVTYSTVTIKLREVSYTVEIDDSTVFSRIRTGLASSLRDVKMGLVDFIVWFVVSLPYLVVWALILFIIVWIIKRIIRRIKRRREQKKQKKLERMGLSERGNAARGEEEASSDDEGKKII